MGLAQRSLILLNRLLGRKVDAGIYGDDYDRCAQTYDAAVTRRLLAAFTGDILKELDVGAGMRCIDLGCGTGHATAILDGYVRPNGSVIGYDISGAMLALAGQRLGISSGTRFVHKDMLCALQGHGDESIDVIAACWSLEYGDPERILKEAQRVLARGGRIAVLVNTRGSLPELQRLVTRILLRNPFSLRSFPPLLFPPGIDAFRRMVGRAGLSVRTLSEKTCVHHFETGESLVEWMKTAGPCAGFRGALREERSEYIYDKIREAVDRMNGVRLTFRFIYFIGIKP
ncbi:MAG: class I SAM-dependent methyltransferase [bacterium]